MPGSRSGRPLTSKDGRGGVRASGAEERRVGAPPSAPALGPRPPRLRKGRPSDPDHVSRFGCRGQRRSGGRARGAALARISRAERGGARPETAGGDRRGDRRTSLSDRHQRRSHFCPPSGPFPSTAPATPCTLPHSEPGACGPFGLRSCAIGWRSGSWPPTALGTVLTPGSTARR